MHTSYMHWTTTTGPTAPCKIPHVWPHTLAQAVGFNLYSFCTPLTVHGMAHPPLALPFLTRHLHVSDHTPWYEQWGPNCTHRSEVEPLRHGLLELQSVAWWTRCSECCGVEIASLVQGTEYCWHGHLLQPHGEHYVLATWGKQNSCTRLLQYRSKHGQWSYCAD